MAGKVLGFRSPVTPLVVLGLAAIAFHFVRTATSRAGGMGLTEDGFPCEVLGENGCDEGTALGGGVPARPARQVLNRENACRDTGYLCVDQDRSGRLDIYRWPADIGTLRIHVPPPSFESGSKARELHRAAVRGIQAWDGHPFRFLIQDRDRPQGGPVDIVVRWSSQLGGSRLGQARTQWETRGEEMRYRVLGLDLATRSPFNSRQLLTGRALELVAAHEMGHALGLPHSDDERDLMYPKNTAGSMSTRDFATMDGLYRLPRGALIELR